MSLNYNDILGVKYTHNKQYYIASKGLSGDPLNILSLEEAKLSCRVDVIEDDLELTQNISAAVSSCEKYVGNSFQRTAYTISTTKFQRVMELPKKVHTSITAITYIDEDGVSQTLGSADYNHDPITNTIIIPNDIPTVSIDHSSPVSIAIECGYDVSGSNPLQQLPSELVSAVKMVVNHLYDNRSDVTQFKQHKLPHGSEYFMNRYKTTSLG